MVVAQILNSPPGAGGSAACTAPQPMGAQVCNISTQYDFGTNFSSCISTQTLPLMLTALTCSELIPQLTNARFMVVLLVLLLVCVCSGVVTIGGLSDEDMVLSFILAETDVEVCGDVGSVISGVLFRKSSGDNIGKCVGVTVVCDTGKVFGGVLDNGACLSVGTISWSNGVFARKSQGDSKSWQFIFLLEVGD